MESGGRVRLNSRMLRLLARLREAQPRPPPRRLADSSHPSVARIVTDTSVELLSHGRVAICFIKVRSALEVLEGAS